MQLSNGQTVMVQGRIVWTSGDLFKGKIKTEFNSDKPKLNNLGEQIREYSFGLAVPKAVLAQSNPGEPGQIWAAMHEEAKAIYPNGIPPSFAMKYKDGDGLDHKGVSFKEREGYADHIVLTLSTSLPIKWFKWENGQNILINEGVKCGDYVNAQVTVKAHGPMGTGKPGLYLNPMAVQFLGFGKEIINTPSGDTIFGTSMPAVPQGASTTPIAPQGGQQLVAPTDGMTAPAQPQAPQVQQGVQPHHGVLPPVHQPQAQPQAPQAPQPQQGGGMPMPPGFGG